MTDGIATRDDAYLAYIRAFFARWSRVYDLFALPIAFVYRAAARQAGAGPGRTIVDLCTGTGEMAVRCARLGAAVTAIDVTDAMLARAVRKARGLPIRFLPMDARHLEFADGTFDAAILSFALHDMPFAARVATLREAARVSRGPVVILDYDPPRGQPWRWLMIGLVGLYETAYFEAFARLGLGPALEAADLVTVETARPLPGFCAIHVARPRVMAPEVRGRG